MVIFKNTNVQEVICVWHIFHLTIIQHVHLYNNVPSHKIQKVCKHDVPLTRKLLHFSFARAHLSENKNLTFTY